jgi:hypothetical protein
MVYCTVPLKFRRNAFEFAIQIVLHFTYSVEFNYGMKH